MRARLDRVFARTTLARAHLGAPQVALRTPSSHYSFGDQDTPFHAASVGKLFTGAVVTQLAQEGRLQLSDPIHRLLPSATLRGLFAADSPRPTVLDLLQHYSGAADYFEGRGRVGVLREIAADPHRIWRPEDLLTFTREHLAPVGPAGTRFHYSDTGFVLLGMIIEELTDERYEDVVTTRIIDRLRLTRTFLPALTEPATGDTTIAPCFAGRDDLSTTAALSCGWAGGGIASTPGDLVRFSRALHSGEVVNRDGLETMRTVRGRLRPGIHYGAAMMELRFDGFSPFLRRLPRPRGHLGSLGTYLFHDPRSDTHLAMNFHSRRELPRLIRTAIAVTSITERNANAREGA